MKTIKQIEMSIQVIFLEVHGMQTYHSLNSQTGYPGAKVKLSNLQIWKRITIFIEDKVCIHK